MRRAYALLAVLPILVFIGQAWSGSRDYLVTPGVGIGPVALGESITDVVRTLGSPSRTIPVQSAVLGRSGLTAYEWSAKPMPGYSDTGGFDVVTDPEGAAIEIWAPFPGPQYATPKGIRVGTKASEVRRIMGDPSRTVRDGAMLIYDSLGVVFAVQTDTRYGNRGLVDGIGVFRTP